MSSTISKAIDPKRTGISKSLITSTALCNRKGWFAEKIRTADGGRLPLIAPERVAFGAALDEAILEIVVAIRENQPWSIQTAHHLGVQAAMTRPHRDDIDWEKFAGDLWVNRPWWTSTARSSRESTGTRSAWRRGHSAR